MGRLLRELPPASRTAFLHGPDLRGFLSEVELWTGAFTTAAVAARASGARRNGALARLFDTISGTDRLTELVPSGRLDAEFPRRTGRLAVLRLCCALDDLEAILLGGFLALSDGAVAFELRPREDPEQGRPAFRIDLGGLASPAGPLGIEITAPSSVALRARLTGGCLELRDGRGVGVLFPLAGSPLSHPPAPGGWAATGRRRATGRWSATGPVRLVRRPLIPGTPILLAPALRSSPRHMRVGRPLPGLEARLARALRLVQLAWPEGHQEIVSRTAMVVPVREPGLVSYSLKARPGVSFINVHGKATLTLADDLLHETAHHLLHDVQETVDLLVRGPETEEVQAFDSPWRGTRRPLHGILHGTYTFLFRAELFARLLDAQRRLPGSCLHS